MGLRVTTGMIYDAGKQNIQTKTSDLLRVQQQLATGRRILQPSDDPVAAAHALEVTQANSQNLQFSKNQTTVKNILALSEGNLQGLQDLYQRVHELAVQMGNTGTLNDNNRKAISAELRERFDQLLSVANETDGLGNYLYSGYKGGVKPFTGTADTGVAYNGDNGQRTQRVSASSLVAISDSGSDIFMNVKASANPFAVSADANNVGSATISDPVVTDQTKWASSSNHKAFTIKFAMDTAGTVTYDIVDDAGISVLTNAAASATAPLPGTNFVAGQPISIKSNVAGGPDYGATFVVTNTPSNGDAFLVRQSEPVSAFSIISDLITAAESPVNLAAGSSGIINLAKVVSKTIANIQAAQDNLSRVQASIGARMNEVDAMASMNSHRDITYRATLSDLQDVDYTAAITEMNKHQVALQSAQKSYVNIAQLSLFNYI